MCGAASVDHSARRRPIGHARDVRWIVVALIALAGCGGPQRCPVAPAPPGAPAFLWRAQKGDGTGPVVWLFGTIHNGSAADVPPVAWAALASSKRFVSEVGDAEPDRDRISELARIERGPGLDALLPADDWWELRDQLRGTMKEDDLKRARPWYAMSRLMRTLAPPPDPTMDFAMTERAKARGIPIDALESWADQLTVLANTVTVADLQETLHARATIRCTLANLLATYRTGDLAAMTPHLVTRASGQLLDARNRTWLPKLEAYFAADGAFVAVGLGHMIGEAGLPALLQSAGYRVQRMSSSSSGSGRVALHVEQRHQDRGEREQALTGRATEVGRAGVGGRGAARRRHACEEEGDDAAHAAGKSKPHATVGNSPTSRNVDAGSRGQPTVASRVVR